MRLQTLSWLECVGRVWQSGVFGWTQTVSDCVWVGKYTPPGWGLSFNSRGHSKVKLQKGPQKEGIERKRGGGEQSDSSRLTGRRRLSFYNWPQSFHCCSQASSAHWARYVARTRPTCLIQDILESRLIGDYHICCRCNVIIRQFEVVVM